MPCISKVEYKGIPPHFRRWRIGLAKNMQSFLYKKAVSRQFKSLPIHSAALEGLIQILKDSPHSLLRNRGQCAATRIKTKAVALLSSKILSKKLLVKRHLNCRDSVNNCSILLIFLKIQVLKYYQ